MPRAFELRRLAEFAGLAPSHDAPGFSRLHRALSDS